MLEEDREAETADADARFLGRQKEDLRAIINRQVIGMLRRLRVWMTLAENDMRRTLMLALTLVQKWESRSTFFI